MIRRLNFNKAKLFDAPELLVFIKPLGSMLTRVFRLPDGYSAEKTKELEQVLNTICKSKRNGTWYFDLRNKEVRNDVREIIISMEVEAIYVSLDILPDLSN